MFRIAIFIDGAYLDKVPEVPKREDIDFVSLVHSIAGDIPILRVYYYHCMPYQPRHSTAEDRQRYSKMHSFIERLKYLPDFEVKLGRLLRSKDADGNWSFKQKQVDVLLSLDMVRQATKHSITHAALVAGDSDYIPAIQAAKDEGVHVMLCYSKKTRAHASLLAAVDRRIPFGSDYLPLKPGTGMDT